MGATNSSSTDARDERPLPLPGTQAEVREFCKLLARILRRRGSEDMAPHEPNAVNTNSRNPNF